MGIMNNHIYFKGEQLTKVCSSCQGRGQLKAADYIPLQVKPNELTFNSNATVGVIIIMCEECDGLGRIMHYDKYMEIKMNNSPNVVWELEKFVNEHMKPEYES